MSKIIRRNPEEFVSLLIAQPPFTSTRLENASYADYCGMKPHLATTDAMKQYVHEWISLARKPG